MSYSTLISAAELLPQLENPDWVIIDCRFALANPSAGAYAYRHGHILQARYADLNQDLSSAVRDYTGRHPLPDFKQLAQILGNWGVANHTQVVVYDDVGGAFAGRLWWLLRTLGHQKVAVLDGGLNFWQRSGLPLTTNLPHIKPRTFRAYLDTQACLTASEVQDRLAQGQIRLLDARAAERYRGEVEPIDPVAGHIPGAVNRPHTTNLAANGLFLPAKQLLAQFQGLLGAIAPENTVHYCGSGVTACHNLLAMEHAGLKGSKLFAGSWSEWIRNKNRAIAVG